MTSDRESGVVDTELEIGGLCAGYGSKLILHNLSLTVRRGELLAVIGANGAGKSTLLRAIMGFATITEGTVTLANQNITNVPTCRRVQMGISYLMQGAGIFPSLTVGENIEIAAVALARKDRRTCINAVLADWPDVKQQLSSRAGLLSGGQRQALALAMVLVHRPRVLLLDEPSAGLAPRAALEAIQRIEKLNRTSGATIIVVEQRVREALGIATRAVIINNGSVYAETNHPSEWLELEQIERYIFGPPTPR